MGCHVLIKKKERKLDVMFSVAVAVAGGGGGHAF